ncbi:hypothetical protein ABLN87_05530 [Ruegeria sp. SCPT10]|uniref:hypothetical protein n=1 Tax=Ruegeria sp. SCP10 TaxID=3141377 RepID=UPI00333BCADC
MVQQDAIAQVMSLMSASRAEYERYLAQGKTFGPARALRATNQQVLDFIEGTPFKAAPELMSALEDLQEHLRDWARIWDQEAKLRAPADEDEFIFTGYKTYPRHLDALLAERRSIS